MYKYPLFIEFTYFFIYIFILILSKRALSKEFSTLKAKEVKEIEKTFQEIFEIES